MIYTDGLGRKYNLDRKQARERDAKEGRQRLVGEQVHAYKQMVAALNAVLFAKEELETRLRKEKLWSSVRLAEECLRKVKMDLAKTITIEQICTLQHDTEGVYIQMHHAQQPDRIPVEMKDLSLIVACARGLLHDHDGKYLNCMNCMAAMDKNAWQNCDLYHLLLKMDCFMDGQYGENALTVANLLDIKGICPFMLGNLEADEDEQMQLD